MDEINRGKYRCAALLIVMFAVLVTLLSYVFVQATHRADPNAQPHAPLHDSKWQRAATSFQIAGSGTVVAAQLHEVVLAGDLEPRVSVEVQRTLYAICLLDIVCAAL